MKMRTFREVLNEDLASDPKLCAAYIRVAAEEGDPALLAAAIGNVIKARGGISKLAREAKLNRPNLQRVLTGKGNPSLAQIALVLDTLGLALDVRPKKRKAA